MLVVDNEGKIFDDRRKGDRRKENKEIGKDEEKRKSPGRRETDQKGKNKKKK